jgi:hypothetical protein
MSQDELELVRRRSERLGALLRETDPPVPALAFPAERVARAARRRTFARWRLVAAAAALAVAAIGVPPVRAWIAQAARGLWSAVARAPRPAAVAPAAAAGPSTATFTPLPGVFALRVTRWQDHGTLTVEIVTGRSASATVVGAHPVAELRVLPGGLTIVNDSASSASFVVRLPAALARIEIAVGGGAPRSLVPRGPGARWVMDLRQGR